MNLFDESSLSPPEMSRQREVEDCVSAAGTPPANSSVLAASMADTSSILDLDSSSALDLLDDQQQTPKGNQQKQSTTSMLKFVHQKSTSQITSTPGPDGTHSAPLGVKNNNNNNNNNDSLDGLLTKLAPLDTTVNEGELPSPVPLNLTFEVGASEPSPSAVADKENILLNSNNNNNGFPSDRDDDAAELDSRARASAVLNSTEILCGPAQDQSRSTLGARGDDRAPPKPTLEKKGHALNGTFVANRSLTIEEGGLEDLVATATSDITTEGLRETEKNLQKSLRRPSSGIVIEAEEEALMDVNFDFDAVLTEDEDEEGGRWFTAQIPKDSNLPPTPNVKESEGRLAVDEPFSTELSAEDWARVSAEAFNVEKIVVDKKEVEEGIEKPCLPATRRGTITLVEKSGIDFVREEREKHRRGNDEDEDENQQRQEEGRGKVQDEEKQEEEATNSPATAPVSKPALLNETFELPTHAQAKLNTTWTGNATFTASPSASPTRDSQSPTPPPPPSAPPKPRDDGDGVEDGDGVDISHFAPDFFSTAKKKDPKDDEAAVINDAVINDADSDSKETRTAARRRLSTITLDTAPENVPCIPTPIKRSSSGTSIQISPLKKMRVDEDGGAIQLPIVHVDEGPRDPGEVGGSKTEATSPTSNASDVSSASSDGAAAALPTKKRIPSGGRGKLKNPGFTALKPPRGPAGPRSSLGTKTTTKSSAVETAPAAGVATTSSIASSFTTVVTSSAAAASISPATFSVTTATTSAGASSSTNRARSMGFGIQRRSLQAPRSRKNTAEGPRVNATAAASSAATTASTTANSTVPKPPAKPTLAGRSLLPPPKSSRASTGGLAKPTAASSAAAGGGSRRDASPVSRRAPSPSATSTARSRDPSPAASKAAAASTTVTSRPAIASTTSGLAPTKIALKSTAVTAAGGKSVIGVPAVKTGIKSIGKPGGVGKSGPMKAVGPLKLKRDEVAKPPPMAKREGTFTKDDEVDAGASDDGAAGVVGGDAVDDDDAGLRTPLRKESGVDAPKLGGGTVTKRRSGIPSITQAGSSNLESPTSSAPPPGGSRLASTPVLRARQKSPWSPVEKNKPPAGTEHFVCTKSNN